MIDGGWREEKVTTKATRCGLQATSEKQSWHALAQYCMYAYTERNTSHTMYSKSMLDAEACRRRGTRGNGMVGDRH